MFIRYIVRRKSDGLWYDHDTHRYPQNNWTQNKEKAQLFKSKAGIKNVLGHSLQSNAVYQRYRDSGLSWHKFRQQIRPELEQWFEERYEIFEVSFTK